MTFESVPQELKDLNQWICWRYEQPGGSETPLTKVPYNPRSGFPASVTNPQDWCPFGYAVQAVASSGYDGVGFVFTDRDPYTGIDLDAPKDEDGKPIAHDPTDGARQQLIYEKMDSYSERSPSGLGIHIIVKARVPHGRKRLGIEMYSTGRYFTMTGDVFRNSPIEDRQALCDLLWSEMGVSAEPNYYAGDFTQHQEDGAIYETASKARNGDLFTRLWQGDASGYFSTSEADFALIDIIAFYTKNRIQIKRMFLASELGKREKYANAKPNRLSTLTGYMINKSFDRMLPPVDISGVIDQVNAALAALKADQAGIGAGASADHPAPEPRRAASADLSPVPSYTLDGFETNLWRNLPPPGILGQMVDFIYAAAPRPVYEIALAAALGLTAGITGRAFNASGTGLNHYIMLLAATGSGKEAMSSGIERLLYIVGNEVDGVPSALQFMGPSEIASGQALLKHLGDRETPCFVTLTGEFGLRLQQMSAPHANSSEVALRRVLLDLYNKSGAGNMVRPTIYSDKKNNTEALHSPAFSLLGESTPETFYKALDEQSVVQGLLPRFAIIEYNGPRVPLNENHQFAQPTMALVAAVQNLVRNVHENMRAGKVVTVGTTPQALAFLNKVNDYADHRINKSDKDILKQLWNRLHIKTFKLAGLLAVGQNFYEPVIDELMARWACSLVMTDTLRLLDMFAAGTIGANNENSEQDEALMSAIGVYLKSDWNAVKTYDVQPAMHNDKIIPYGYLQRKLVSMACFRHDKRNSTVAIKAAIQTLVEGGLLAEVPIPQLRDKYKFTGRCYVATNPGAFLS